MLRKADTMNKLFKVVLNRPIVQWVEPTALEINLDNNYYLPKYLETREILLNSGLEIKTLSTLVNNDGFITGSTPDYKEEEIKEGAVLLKTVNVERNELNTSKLFYINKENHQKLKRSQLNKGDLVITVIGATDEVIGRTIVYDGRFKNANITQSLAKFRVRETYDEFFVSTFLNSKYGHNLILQMSSSSTRRYVNNTELGQILVPIPSIEIQKYIGNKVRKAEELREEAKRLKEELYEVINKLFPILSNNEERKYNFVIESLVNSERLDPDYYSSEHIAARVALSKFQTIKLKDIAYITDGDHGTPEFKKEGVKFLRNKNVGEFIVDYSDLVYIDKAYEEKYLKSSRLQAEDILLTKIGSIGRSAIFLDAEANLNANSALIRITHDKFSPYFLCVLFNSNLYQIIFNKEAGGAVQSALSLNRLGEIPIPIISQEIQSDIEQKLKRFIDCTYLYTQLINEAKQDVEDLIEGKFDESKISEGV